MILKNNRHALRLTAAGGMLLTALMAGCTVPATNGEAKLVPSEGLMLSL